ncbi:class I SAM-dependent methyltransferase [Escherichia coli]|uniref:class I SAM-dependent methyltransferase n=1 Tax=Escherichia coli TaxID=562 RepID=UPI003B976308
MTTQSHHDHVEKQFSSQASEYLISAVHASGRDLLRLAVRLADYPDASVLDMGCGAGHASFVAAQNVSAVVAYDLSAQMLDVVAQAAEARQLKNITTRIWLQTVEALRDISHVRNYASGEWLTLINEANLVVDNLIADKLPLEFSSWVARMRTPELLVDAIRVYQQSALTEVKTYFALQNDGSFTSDTIMVEAHKAA